MKSFNSIVSFIFVFLISVTIFSQTIIINEFSNGPAGAQEYIEFIVVDDNAFYDCGNSAPPCVDIRGWIIDDNSGYHGTGGIAAGCNRFSYNSFWECIPIGTIITVYNDVERNTSLPPDDLIMTDNNCSLIIPINNLQLFDNNLTTPGAVACSYPSTGWVPGGNWTRIGMANTGDCARLVNLAGCEVSSLCYGNVNLNTQVYFTGNGADNVWSFSDGNSTIQTNWSEGCADNETTLDAGSCSIDNQTPGVPNNSLNSAFIAQFNNNCLPIQPLSLIVTGTVSQSCTCDGSASISASGSIGPYTYAWFDNFNVSLGQTNSTASNLCSGNYYCVVTSSINCKDTIPVFVGSICSNYGTFASATMIENCVNNQFYNTTWANLPDQINPNGVLLDSYNYGPFFQNSNTLILRGGEVKTYKNAGANVCGAKLLYTVYTVGNQPTNPVFTVLNLPFKESCNIGANNFPTGGPCFNASDQKWAKENYNIDLTTYPPGDYVIEVYYAVPGSYTSTTACNDTIYVNNNGNNYKALFQIKPQPFISGGPLTICPGNFATLTSNFTSGNTWSTTSTNQSVSINAAGTYTLTVNLNNSCPSSSDNETISAYASPTVEAGPNQTTCEGSGAITLNGVIGGSATGLLWSSPSGSFSSNNSASTTYTPSITSGVVTIVLTATGPCPSIQDQLILSVNATPTVNAGSDQTICAGSSVNLSGAFGGSANSLFWSAPFGSFSNTTFANPTYTPTISSGSVTLTLTASGPCPSISDQIVININSPTTPSFTQISPICSGGSITLPTSSLNGITGSWSPSVNNSASTNYTFTPSAGQCATTTNMTVVINSPTTPTFNQVGPICSGNTFSLPSTSLNGITGAWSPVINNSSTTNYAFTPSAGQCANNSTMTVVVNPNFSVNATQTVCPSQIPYVWNGVTFNAPGIQIATLSSINNCDSLVTMTLNVNSTFISNTNLSVCPSDLPYSWNGLTFNGSGTQTATLQDVNGCDSLATLNLQVSNNLSSSENIVVCTYELPYSWNGLIFSSPGTQTATLQSIGGCDSLATLNLSVNPFYNETESISICSNETPYLWNGLSLSSSSNQTVTLNSINGCDSIVTLNLTVLPFFTTTLDSTICENEFPLIWNGLTINSEGTQTLNLTSGNGCDSLVIMNVQVLPLPQISILGGNTYCEGEVVNSITGQITGQSPFSISFIVNGTPIAISSNDFEVILGDSAGTYTLVSITDNNCTNSSLNESETIEIFPVPQPPIAFGDSTYCMNSVIDSLNSIALLGSSVNWYNTMPFQTPFEVGSSALPEMIQGLTTYYVTQELNGCISPADSVMVIFEICDIIVPTAFTPDGDNTNDFWNLGNIDDLYPNNLVTIYNRWGNLIYQSQPGKYQSKPWDGTHNQEPMPVGSYYFIIEFGEKFKGNESGIVSILK